jgi:hypothetical protein
VSSCVVGTAGLAALAWILPLTTGRVGAEGLPTPNEEDRLIDTDGDGLADLYEAWLGTDPNCPDTDMDGIPDGREVAQKTNPLVPTPVSLAESSVKLDFVPEAGSIRFIVTVFSRSCFAEEHRLTFLEGLGDRVYNQTRAYLRIGTTFRSGDGWVISYVSDRLPLRDLPARFSLGAVLREGRDVFLDDSLVGVRQRHFFRTEETVQGDGTVLGSTVFITPVVLAEAEPGFSPNEDCKQIFGRISGPIKIILNEFCEAQMDRFCPSNCGSDVGIRVVCIRDMIRR